MGVTGTPAKNERPLRVLFVHNALYSACLLKEGFRALGHRADNLYFDFHRHSKDLTWGCDFDLPGRWWATPLHLGFLAYALARYDVFHFLGKPYLVPACYAFLRVPAPWDLALLKRAGKTVVYQSDGCYNMIRPSAWKTRIDPAICHVCQTTQGGHLRVLLQQKHRGPQHGHAKARRHPMGDRSGRGFRRRPGF
jgi:hypothetical protein